MSAAETLKTPPSVAPGSFRHTVLTTARRFKASWTEMGKLLVEVFNKKSYEEWGYESFDAYVTKELHIRKSTADKLLKTFNFLKSYEPKIVEEADLPERAPAFEVVEVLADAEARGQLSPSEYKSIRDSIWDSEKTTSELRKDLVERFPKPQPPAPPSDISLRRYAQTARKLANELGASSKVPKAVSERAAALADDLEELASSKAAG
ncbi:MAG: hypothetical protein ACJ790_15125 [Myxococcaceae bacterium]